MKKVLRNLDKPLLISNIILFTIGLLMVFSSSNIAAYMRYNKATYHFFVVQIIALIAGLIGGLITIKINSKYYKFLASGGIIAIIVLLLGLLIYGTATNDTVGWISLGFFQLQPSELAKIIVIIWLATYYDQNKQKLENYIKALFPLVIAGVIAFLIISQPDYGTAFIFSIIIFFMFLVSPSSKSLKKAILSLLMLLSIVLILTVFISRKQILENIKGTRLDYMNSCSEEKFYNIGNQVCNGYIAINSGGLFGKGLSNSTQKYLYLPEAHTDFIFAIVIEELGLIIGLIIIMLYIYVLYRIIKIGRNSYNLRGQLICYGIAFYIFTHIFINLGGLLGIIPLTGVPLPFISYGGTFIVCLIMALSFVQVVNIETQIIKKGVIKKKK